MTWSTRTKLDSRKGRTGHVSYTLVHCSAGEEIAGSGAREINEYFVDLRTYRPPRGTAHFHVYVAGPDHPAARF